MTNPACDYCQELEAEEDFSDDEGAFCCARHRELELNFRQCEEASDRCFEEQR